MTDTQIAALAKVKILWCRMCRANGIDPASKFVVFSDSNPVAKEYNEAMNAYQNAVNDFREIPTTGKPVQNPAVNS